jgi:uncharacterized protein (DUF58 family)
LLYIFFLAALGTLDGGLLVLAIPLVLYLGIGLIFGPRDLNIEVTRELSADYIPQGEPIDVSLTITNRGARLEEALVEDVLPAQLEVVSGDYRVLTTLKPGGSTTLHYKLRPPRGMFRFQQIRITANDYFGVHRRTAEVSAPGRVYVQPRSFNLGRVAIRPSKTRVYAGQIPARQGGAGVEFFGVRGYHPGDPLRWINWNASARHAQQLFTNEFEQERVADVGLILDARMRNNIVGNGQSLFEFSVQATAALAETFLTDSHRVGLLLYGDFLDWTFPGYGKLQKERILQALARARTGRSMIFEKLDNLPARLFPVNSQLVFVSPLLSDDLDTLIRLRARGYQVLVISPDPIDFEIQFLEQKPNIQLATRIAYLERRLLLKKMEGAGIRVLDWQVGVPLDQAVHSSLRRLPPWFRAQRVRL